MSEHAPADYVSLPPGDFRSERQLLAPHVFAIPWGHRPRRADLVTRDTWLSITGLPTDAVLRTTAHQGRVVEELHRVWTTWVDALPGEPGDAPYLFAAMLDTADELQAAPVIALHGYYR